MSNKCLWLLGYTLAVWAKWTQWLKPCWCSSLARVTVLLATPTKPSLTQVVSMNKLFDTWLTCDTVRINNSPDRRNRRKDKLSKIYVHINEFNLSSEMRTRVVPPIVRSRAGYKYVGTGEYLLSMDVIQWNQNLILCVLVVVYFGCTLFHCDHVCHWCTHVVIQHQGVQCVYLGDMLGIWPVGHQIGKTTSRSTMCILGWYVDIWPVGHEMMYTTPRRTMGLLGCYVGKMAGLLWNNEYNFNEYYECTWAIFCWYGQLVMKLWLQYQGVHKCTWAICWWCDQWVMNWWM